MCCHSCLCLQTKRTGEDAKSVTEREFNDMLKELVKLLEEKKKDAGLQAQDKFYLCYDNASVHESARKVLGTKWLRWEHPAKSPECNKPVEHIHAVLDAHMHKWVREQLRQNPTHRLSPEECLAENSKVFHALPVNSIYKDVMSLPDTWNAIVAAKGGHIASKYT